MSGRISHSASNFQAALVTHSLWHADCLSSGGCHFSGEQNSHRASINVTATPDQQKGAQPWNLYPFSTGIAFCARTISGRYSSPFDMHFGWGASWFLLLCVEAAGGGSDSWKRLLEPV